MGFEIKGLDVSKGISFCGDEEMYLEILGDFYLLIDPKTEKIKRCIEEKLIKDYTIEVHALKNTSRLIGATELSRDFEYLEQLGHSGDVEGIELYTDKVLEKFNSYKDVLRKYGKQGNEEKQQVSSEEIVTCLKSMYNAVDCFDMDTCYKEMERLETYLLPDICSESMEKLRVYMADVAMEDIMVITKDMIDVLEG